MPPEIALLESRALRDSVSTRTEALDKVKVLVMLPDDLHVTTKMVADYFEVTENTIYCLCTDHRDELNSNGYRVLTGQELTVFKTVCGIRSSRSRSAALFPRRAVLNVAMLLRDSEVARRVRGYLLDAEASRREPAFPPPPPVQRRLGPGPCWDEYEYLRTHPEAPVPEQYFWSGPDPDQGRWMDWSAWAESVDQRLHANSRIIGAMSEQLCGVSEDVRELRGDMSAMRSDMSELRQGMAQLLPGFGLGRIPAQRRRKRH
ncbi:hypothetical protein [Streptacidiphilus sp. EB129]|jgi:hypothetical protein|uniref:hypothetical protein n=1 Tax=Streptacidiphilus sp. EB129 TaxID=3156262 RepID=UPI0035137D96